MKIRIYPTGENYFRFKVQIKRWYGWETIYKATLLKYCEEYVEDLKRVINIELVKQ